MAPLFLILRKVFFFIAFLVLLISILDFINLSFTLDRGRQVLAEQLESYTGREVRIDGKVELTVSFPPQLLVQQIHIRNINDFGNEDFISVRGVRIEVPLQPLLSGQLYLSDISANHAEINLVQKKDGSHNWSFINTTGTSTETKKVDSNIRNNKRQKLSMGLFQLTNVVVTYRHESQDHLIHKRLDHLIIDIKDTTKPYAEISGDLQNYPYNLTFTSDALQLLASGKPWGLHGTGHIANRLTELKANIQLLEQVLEANINININNIDLGILLDTLRIIQGQDAVSENISIDAKLHGSNLVELYKQAEVRLRLGKGHWNIQSADTAQKKQLSFTRVSSFASWDKPVEFHLNGMISGEKIKLDFKTNRLLEFFDETQKLDIDLVSNVVETEITLKGALDLPVQTKKFQLDISLKGKDLERLNPIFNSELPPFNNYTLTGRLVSNNTGFVLRSAKASIGNSLLETSIIIDTKSAKPFWVINLHSQQLQLQDFAIDDFDVQRAITTTEISKNKNIREASVKPLMRLEEIMRAPKVHFNLNLNVNKLLSGEDLLGKAQFQLHLRDGAVSLKNADIEIPGGRIKASATFQAEENEITGELELNIDKLDYGITARLFNPESQVDGIISSRIYLQLRGSDATRMLDKATGLVDIALWPKNTRPAKALNLWATNLYLILLPELKKKESLVNCMVALMDIDDGYMKEQFFVIDTTKLWIDGNINVDFKREHVKLSLFPQSKTARFFALQSPIRVDGSFSDIRMAVSPLDLAGSYVFFITSPFHVPARWIFEGKIPENGSATCEQYYDREYVMKQKEMLKKQQQKEIKNMLDDDY